MPERRRDLTVTALSLGLVLAIVMGAANVYLGLRAGMTISASIPAAVIALAILNGLMGRESIQEANLVQTAASSGESLAAGIIFTIPALLLTGIWTDFDFWTTTAIGLAGGLLGTLLMIPMRRVFVVNDPHLHFPEAVACAEVLKTAQRAPADGAAAPRAATGAKLIFAGMAVGGTFKVLEMFLHVVKGSIEVAVIRAGRVFYFGGDLAPAMIGVGMIVGLPIATQVFAGGAIGWLVTIPVGFTAPTDAETAVAAATDLWKSQVRYMGVGAMLVGGVVSIWKVRRGLWAAVTEITSQLRPRHDKAAIEETDRDISAPILVLLTIVSIGLIAGIYFRLLHSVGSTVLITAVMLVMAFFFTAVASYLVGLVGNSNSPVSGMTITAVLGTAGAIYLCNRWGILDIAGNKAILATLGVAGVVCCVASLAGDACNDLKTGYLVGASPRDQQIVEVVACIGSAFVIAPVLTLLHHSFKDSGGIGGSKLPAPQAGLFASLAQGFFGDGHIPWTMVLIGLGVGAALIVGDFVLASLRSSYRLHVMPVAVGIYLPLKVSVPILIGGLIAFALSRVNRKTSHSESGRDVLIASGVIAGESLMAILLAFLMLAVQLPTPSENWDTVLNTVSLVGFVLVIAWMFWMSIEKNSRTGGSRGVS